MASYDPAHHHRQSIRLQDYDYSQDGMYFVTICTQRKVALFGEVVGDTVRLNDAGRMVEKWWQKLSEKFSNVEIDEYVVMPNHFHGIVVIVGADPCVCPETKAGAHVGAPLQKPTLGDIVRWFKTMSTTEYIRGVKQNGWESCPGKLWQRNLVVGERGLYARRGWESCPGKLWQRNYYEHVIRNESSLNDIRSYIQANPARWAEDDENPARLVKEVAE